MRLILFSGKGGSGVTTIAAATAAAIAAGRRRTLAFALTPGLSDAFGLARGAALREISPDLTIADGTSGAAEGDELRRWLGDLLEWKGMEAGLAEDLAALPGLNTIGRLLELERHAPGGPFEVIVLDGGPLSQFLELPAALDAAARWLERLFAPRQQTVLEPFFRVFAAEYASTGDDVFERGRELLSRLARLRELFTNVEQTSVRLVTRPSSRAATDVKEASAALGLYSYPVDAVAANQLLPKLAGGEPFGPEPGRLQEEAPSGLAADLSPMPVLALSLQASEPAGLEALLELARLLYGGRDPAALFRQANRASLRRHEGRYLLSLPAPFAQREELRLEQLEEAVVIHLNGRRCLVPLPGELRYHEAASWSLEGEMLTVVFEL